MTICISETMHAACGALSEGTTPPYLMLIFFHFEVTKSYRKVSFVMTNLPELSIKIPLTETAPPKRTALLGDTMVKV